MTIFESWTIVRVGRLFTFKQIRICVVYLLVLSKRLVGFIELKNKNFRQIENKKAPKIKKLKRRLFIEKIKNVKDDNDFIGLLTGCN